MNIEMDLIYERAWSFSKKTGVDFKDLVSEATEAYLKAQSLYDKEKNVKITSLAYKMINRALFDFCRNEIKARHLDLQDFNTASNTVFSSFFSNDLKLERINTFPKNVKKLVEIIFEHADDFDLTKPRKCTSHLLYILEFKYGWGQKRRKNSIRQLKQILQTTPENELF
ncbi:MAG: sigma factor [Bacteroidales bacterium]